MYDNAYEWQQRGRFDRQRLGNRRVLEAHQAYYLLLNSHVAHFKHDSIIIYGCCCTASVRSLFCASTAPIPCFRGVATLLILVLYIKRYRAKRTQKKRWKQSLLLCGEAWSCLPLGRILVDGGVFAAAPDVKLTYHITYQIIVNSISLYLYITSVACSCYCLEFVWHFPPPPGFSIIYCSIVICWDVRTENIQIIQSNNYQRPKK